MWPHDFTLVVEGNLFGTGTTGAGARRAEVFGLVLGQAAVRSCAVNGGGADTDDLLYPGALAFIDDIYCANITGFVCHFRKKPNMGGGVHDDVHA